MISHANVSGLYKGLDWDSLAKSYLNINDLQKHEIEYTNLPILLRYEDKNSMRFSVEARVPFIDHEVLENALSVKTRYKIKDGWTKYLLRRILEKFHSSEVVWRRSKLGFNAPENLWLEQMMPQMKNEVLGSKILRNISYIDRLEKTFDKLDRKLQWRLYNVAVWERVYGVK